MKSKDTTYYLFSLLACFYLGCGGGDGSQDEPANGNATSGKPSGGDTKVALAEFLPGKRVTFSLPTPNGPPGQKEATMLFQFETDETITMGVVANGKPVAFTGKKPTFKVDGLKVIMSSPAKKGDATITFTSASPKVGDKIVFWEPGEKKDEETTISAIEKAGKLEPMASLANPEPAQPNPEGLGGPAFGIGPNGESAKSKHPTFMVHTWNTAPFSRGAKHTAVFGKDGTLTITPAKGKPAKGTWVVAGPVVTLTYPNAETGKVQSLKYRFLFGGEEIEGDDGKSEVFECLYLMPKPGEDHLGISYQRPLPSDDGGTAK